MKGKKMIKLFLKICGAACFLVFFLLGNDSTASINVPLTITDYAGIARISDPVTSGIPIPESANIISINQLQITDSAGNNVPAQFMVTSRWRGTPDDNSKPIKWVLLDFQADVPANGTSVYYLKNGNIGNAQNTNLSLQQDNDKITINTGKAKFEINKKYFNMFDYVWIDKNNDSQIDDAIVSSPNEGGAVLTDRNGTKYYTTLEAPEEIKIEEQGPMRTVVKVRGVFKSEDGSYFAPSVHNPDNRPKFDQPYENSFVYYNCRIHFYNNKDYVKVFFTLENNGANGRTNPEQFYAPVQIVYFDSLNLIVKQNSDNQINIASEDSSTQLSFSDDFTLYQDWKENLTDSITSTLEPIFNNGIYYTTKKNGQELSNGSTNPGWVDANDNSQGIGLAIRHFWQNFPNKITVNNSEIKIGLWPEKGYFPYCQQNVDDPDNIYCGKAGRDAGVYLFDAGRHKTYEMFLRFYSGNQDSQTQILSKSLENPLMALATSEWYTKTKALGMIGPGGLASTDSEINEAMERYDKLQTAMVYEEDSDNIWTILGIKTFGSPHWEFPYQNKFFGWTNFGDLVWVGGTTFSSLHYDWTQKMLLHYVRTGKRKLFDAGVEMAKHRYDIDQYHGERTSTEGHHLWTNHFQFYELDGHGLGGRVSKPTHNWNSGIILYYLLTGDRKALKAAEDNTKGILNHFGEGGLFNANKLGCTGEIRSEGWSMLNLINIYRVTGNPTYLETAKNIAKNRVLYTEQDSGGRGFVGMGLGSSNLLTAFEAIPCECVEISNACKRCKNSASGSLSMCYINEGLIAVHQETQDEELGALLVRIADFLKDEMIFGGDYDENGNYRTLRVAGMWIEEDPDGSIRMSSEYPKKVHLGGASSILTLFWADYFAYAYQLTNNSEYLELSRKCFRDMMFYYISPTEYVNPEYRSMIAFKDNMFVNVHTKVHGWIGRTNQVYLHTEWQLQQGELQIVTSSLPNGTVSQDYSYPISVAGGTAPYTWTYSDIPSWLTVNTVNEAMREISGISPQAGSFSFAVHIEDSTGATVVKQFTLQVKEQTDSDSIVITTQSLPEAIVGSEYVASLNASGGSQPYVWSIDSSNLPAGIYLEGNTLLGIPEETGLYEFIITVNDGFQKAAKNLFIKVAITDDPDPDIDITDDPDPDPDIDITDDPDPDPDIDITDIEVYETNCNFGSVNIGKSAGWTFVIFNKGVAALTIHSISSDNQVFSIVSPLFPAEIGSGETLNVTARFTPQVEGEICGILVINSNDPDEGKIEISIVGTGDNSASVPNVVTVTFRNKISDTTLDSYWEGYKDKNLGGMSILDIWSNSVRKILLRPDFSQSPADVVIEKVELKFYCYSLNWPSQNPKFEVYRITHDWKEGEGIWYKDTNGGATWNEYDRDPVEINDWGMPGGDIDTTTDFGYGSNGIVSEAVMQEESWVTFDITDLAQKWISNEMENYGILIQAIDKDCNEARFYSSEYADESLRPMLVVSYSNGHTEAFAINSSELSQGTKDTDYEASISAAGGSLPYQWSIQGLPAGLDWRYLDDTAITIYGIPTESGQFSLEVTVEDNSAQTLTAYLTLTIVEPDAFRNSISDTTLDSYWEGCKNKNLGGMSSLDIWSNGVRKVLLRPDFFKSLADAVIEKVELKFYCYSLNWPSQNPKLEVYRITHEWEEGEGIWYKDTTGGATWYEYDRNPVEINDWSTPGGDIDTTTDFGYGSNGIVSEAVMQEESWVTFDITDLAQKWISNEMENYGILIQAIDKDCNEARFYSSEYADESLRPEFKIEYSY
jgi:hypothetical protein